MIDTMKCFLSYRNYCLFLIKGECECVLFQFVEHVMCGILVYLFYREYKKAM